MSFYSNLHVHIMLGWYKQLSIMLQVYRGVIESFKDAAGLPEEAILDVRGNHDAFDVLDR